MQTEARNELLRELSGNQCRCGSPKAKRMTFCSGCYYDLPKPLRGRLFRRFGEGYEEAYAEAVQLLDERVVPPKLPPGYVRRP